MPSYEKVRSLLDQYSKPPKTPKIPALGRSTEPTFGELNLFEKGIDLLSRPLYTVASAAHSVVSGKGNPLVEAGRGFIGQRRTSFSDVLGAAGIKKGPARSVAGFAGDVLLDPLSYVGIGPVRKAATVTIGGVARHLTREGASKVASLTDRASARLVERLPQLTDAQVGKVASLASKRNPAVKALLRDQTPEQLRKQPNIMGLGIAQRDIRKTLEKTPSLEAPTAIKFAGMEIPGTAALLKTQPIKKGLDLAEKIPWAGKNIVKPVRDFGAKAGGAARAIFSGKTGNKEFDFLRATARDAKHRMDVEAGEFAKAVVKEAEDIVGGDPLRRKALNEEILKFLEGVDQDVIRLEMSDLAKAIDKRVNELEKAVEALTGRLTPIESKVAPLKKALAEATENLAKAPIKVAEGLEAARPGLMPEAVRKAIRDEEQALKQLEANDLLAEIRNAHGGIHMTPEFLAKRGSTKAAELRDAVPSKYLGGGSGIDEIATSMGFASDEDALDAIIAAGKARKALRDKIAGLKGTKKELKAAGTPPKPVPRPPEEKVAGFEGPVEGMPIKIPTDAVPETGVPKVDSSAIPREAMDAVEGKWERDELAKLEAEGRAEINRIQSEIKQSTMNPKKFQALKAQLDDAKAKLAEVQTQRQKMIAAGTDVEDVRYRERVDYTPSDPRVAALGLKLRERLKKIYTAEKKVNPLLGERQRYVPHIMPQHIKDALVRIIQHNPHQILKTNDLSTFSKHALQRSNAHGILDAENTVAGLIRTGDIDIGRLRETFKKEGIALDAFDEALFETDPIKAILGRELSHNRAVSAGEFVDDILNSPAFNKGAVSVDALLRLRQYRGDARAAELLARDPEVANIQRILEQHPGHSLFVPSPEYVRQFLTPAEQLAMKQGQGAKVDLLQAVDLDALAQRGDLPKGTKAYIIPDEIADHLNKSHRLMFDDKRVSEFLQVFDKAQGWWKTFSTVVRPAFHVRNALSNYWQNYLAGVTDPSVYLKAHLVANPELHAKTGNIGQYTAAQVYKLAEEFGILKHGFIGSEIGEFLERSVRPSKNLLSTKGPLAEFGQKLGTSIEDNARLANFIDGLQKGMDAQSAAMRTKKYLFDYADLSEVEKGFFRRVMPFYTFTRKSIPLALETLITQPGKVAALGKARAEAEKGFESLNHEYVAEYINEAFGVPVHKNKDGTFEYFLLKGYIPTVDLAKLDHKELLGMLSPFVKAPIEQMLNMDFYRMKPISRFPTETVEFMGVRMPAKVAHLLRNIVVMASVDREFVREGATPTKGAVGFLTGIRLQNQNPVDQMRRYVLSSQVEMGEFKRLAERARAAGHDGQAEQYEAMLALQKARRDDAKAKTLKLDPKAFKFGKPKAAPKPQSMPDFNAIREKVERDMRFEAILKQQKRKAQ